MAEREHDVVLFGATGFTGRLTAEYLVANAPEGARLALAGRNMEKLEGVREQLGREVPLLHADVTDAESLRATAESAKVVITTVGPTSATASRWSRPARRQAPTISTSRASPCSWI